MLKMDPKERFSAQDCLTGGLIGSGLSPVFSFVEGEYRKGDAMPPELDAEDWTLDADGRNGPEEEQPNIQAPPRTALMTIIKPKTRSIGRRLAASMSSSTSIMECHDLMRVKVRRTRRCKMPDRPQLRRPFIRTKEPGTTQRRRSESRIPRHLLQAYRQGGITSARDVE